METSLTDRISALGLTQPACDKSNLRFAFRCKDCKSTTTKWHLSTNEVAEDFRARSEWYGEDLGNEVCECGFPTNVLVTQDVTFEHYHITTAILLMRQWIVHGRHANYAMRCLLICSHSAFRNGTIDMYPIDGIRLNLRGYSQMLRQLCAIRKNKQRVMNPNITATSRASVILARYAFVRSVLAHGRTADEIIAIFEQYYALQSN